MDDTDRVFNRRGAARRFLATVLFTDIVNSTVRAGQLGDQRWRDLVERHNAIVRHQLRTFAGREMDTAGDGFFAVFETPERAVRCAQAIVNAVQALDIEVRAGIHTGECELIGGKVGGITVVIGARIGASAQPSEVLVSGSVRDLMRGSGLSFEDAGERVLKGIDEPWRVYRVLSDDAASSATRTGPRLFVTRRQKRRAYVVAAAVAVALVAVAAIYRLTRAAPEVAVGENAVGVIAGSEGRVTAAVDVGLRPTAVAAAGGTVWVTNSAGNTVTRIDERTKVPAAIPVGLSPTGVAAGAGSIWVANSGEATVSRIDPTTSQVTSIPVRAGPSNILVAFGSVWVTNTLDASVTEIDPVTNAVRAVVPVGVNPSGIAAGAGFLWVTNEGDGTVTRFRPKSHTVDSPIRVGNSPAGIAIVDGAAWVANNLDGSLSRIDVDDLSVTSRTLAKAGGAYGVAAAPGTVWVSNEHSGNLMRLTTSDFRVVDTVNVGGAPLGLAFVGDDLWFTSAGGGRALHRGGVLTAVGPALTDTPDDPAVLDLTQSYDGDSWRLASVLYDGLVGFRHTGGVEGTQLVPDLATVLPAPTDGGRTYTFHVRKGIRYSNGTVVRPGDIRRGIERTVAHDTAPFDYYASAIVGGQACRDAIQRATAAKRARPDCNLSKGIVADDESGTITFHLTRPAPEFLYQLALPSASAVPQGTPLDLMRGSFLPSTGPYTVKTYTPKGVGRDGKPSRGRLELVRNTFFREWSRAAQPAGYVDRILVETGYTEEQAVRLVIDGRADLLWRELGAAGPTDLATRYGSLLHTTSGVGTLYLFLNTRRPPFDNIDARRAVAFALDRKALMSGDGELFDGPVTCQLIPPGFAGYKPYCPFTVGSGDNRARWTAPDRAQARRLVQVSRTGGAKVTLGVFDDAHFRAATERVADVLRDLGYHPELREEAQDRYFTLATDPNKPFNAGLAGWYADYPAASNYIGTIASCLPGIGFFNASGYCDEEIDKGIAAAFQQQVSEPGKASDLWAELDRKVVDKAATIPFGNNVRDDFVSRRVGNVLIQKGTGPVISQMWVQ